MPLEWRCTPLFSTAHFVCAATAAHRLSTSLTRVLHRPYTLLRSARQPRMTDSAAHRTRSPHHAACRGAPKAVVTSHSLRKRCLAGCARLARSRRRPPSGMRPSLRLRVPLSLPGREVVPVSQLLARPAAAASLRAPAPAPATPGGASTRACRAASCATRPTPVAPPPWNASAPWPPPATLRAVPTSPYGRHTIRTFRSATVGARAAPLRQRPYGKERLQVT